jgi:hypothetical protein
MNEGNYGQPGNEGPQHSRVQAIIIYVLSEDLSFMPSGRPRHAVSSVTGK